MNKNKLKQYLKNFVQTNKTKFFQKKMDFHRLTGTSQFTEKPTTGLYLIVSESLNYNYKVIAEARNIGSAISKARSLDIQNEENNYYVIFVRALHENNTNIYARIEFPSESKTIL